MKIFFNIDNWEQRKLGELVHGFNYGLNAAATSFDGENKYLRITDIDDSSHEFIQDGVTSPETDLENADDYLLHEGDILFVRTGASVGKTYRYKYSDGKVYYAGFLIKASIKSEFDSEFVFQNTLTDRYNKFIKVISQRSGQPGVNAEEYRTFQILIPSFEEQNEIGRLLKKK
ncbi:type I restriction-modification system subunit S [Listeria grayi FSL F6-1183]|uniref:Type I restriction-modification system subunit S n=1 Tax=Listeria grayi FSL F6-1183 TaxID=1265827 RepID=A0A829R457_LISGR|nr:type I restriction-modification system subunit S [Listeria grayi FSL F6-1183]